MMKVVVNLSIRLIFILCVICYGYMYYTEDTSMMLPICLFVIAIVGLTVTKLYIIKEECEDYDDYEE